MACDQPARSVRKPLVFLAIRRRRLRHTASHPSCVEPPDLASVSPIMRSFSKSVRPKPAPVSANLRQKLPLIARQALHHCAPLHIAVNHATIVQRISAAGKRPVFNGLILLRKS